MSKLKKCLIPLELQGSDKPISPFMIKLLHTGNIFPAKTLFVCNICIIFVPIKQKSHGCIIQKK